MILLFFIFGGALMFLVKENEPIKEAEYEQYSSN